MNLKSLFLDNHPPILQLLIRFSSSLLGLNELSARLPSAIFSALATVALGFLANKLLDAPSAILAMLLHSVSPVSIQIAQLARPYAAFEFFAVVQVYTFVQFCRQKNSSHRKALLIASFLAVLTSYLAVMLFVFEGMKVLVQRRLTLWLLWGAALFILMFAFSKEFISWESMDWQLLRYQMDPYGFLPIEPALSWIYYSVISGAGFLIILFLSSIQKNGVTKGSLETQLIAGLIILLTLIVISISTKRALFVPRYYEFLVPFFVLILSNQFFQIWRASGKWRKSLASIGLASVFVGAGMTLSDLYPIPQAPWKQTANLVAAYPFSLVITSASPSLQFPYFSRYQIPLRTISSSDKLNELLSVEMKAYQSVWLIDTPWGYLNYKQDFLLSVGQLGFRVEDHSTHESRGDNLVILRLIR